MNLIEVSSQTKIRLNLLEAIESDDLEKIPGNFFARSFVRQYAATLGFDAAEIEADLEEVLLARAEPDLLEQLAAANTKRPGAIRQAAAWLAELAGSVAGLRWAERVGKPVLGWLNGVASRPVGSVAWLALAVVACSGLYAWWQKGHRAAEEVYAQQPIAVAQMREPVASAHAAPAPRAAEPAPAPVAAPAVQETPDLKALVVDVGTSRPTWVRVTSDGKVIFTGTLQPHDRRTFQSSRAMRVFTGNAGALEVRFNGRPMGPVGPEGQGRVVDVTAEGLRVSPPPKPRFVYDPLG